MKGKVLHESSLDRLQMHLALPMLQFLHFPNPVVFSQASEPFYMLFLCLQHYSQDLLWPDSNFP